MLPEYQGCGIGGKLLQVSSPVSSRRRQSMSAPGSVLSPTLPIHTIPPSAPPPCSTDSIASAPQEVVDLADQHTPSQPLYLEASQAGKPMYEQKFNFEVVGNSEYVEMARFGPKKA